MGFFNADRVECSAVIKGEIGPFLVNCWRSIGLSNLNASPEVDLLWKKLCARRPPPICSGVKKSKVCERHSQDAAACARNETIGGASSGGKLAAKRPGYLRTRHFFLACERNATDGNGSRKRIPKLPKIRKVLRKKKRSFLEIMRCNYRRYRWNFRCGASLPAGGMRSRSARKEDRVHRSKGGGGGGGASIEKGK